MSSFFDEIGRGPSKPGKGPSPYDSGSQDSSFFDALEALRKPVPVPQGPPVAQEPPAVLASQQAPQAPEQAPVAPGGDVGSIEAGLKGLGGAGVQLVGGAIKGAGLKFSSIVNPWLEKVNRLPGFKDVVWLTGLGDDTLIAEGVEDLRSIRAGEGQGQHDWRQTSDVWKAGQWAEDTGYEVMGITPEVQQKFAYKATNAIGQALIQVGAVVATDGYALLPMLAASGGMEYASTYDMAKQYGASNEEADAHASRKATAMMALEYMSFLPAIGAATRAGKMSAGAAAKSTFNEPIAAALEKALVKRGVNVRNPVVRRAVAAPAMGLAEGSEEYLTGLYGDVDAKYLGERWAPQKSWAMMLAGPERVEEFALGFIGGAGATVVTSNGIQFTEERKAAAKEMYRVAARRRGYEGFSEYAGANKTEAQVEQMFHRAEAMLNTFHGSTQEEIAAEIKNVKARVEKAKNIDQEVEMLMLLDGLHEILPHAKSAKSNPKAKTEAARQAAAEAEGSPLEDVEPDMERASIAVQLRDVVKSRGIRALDSIEQGLNSSIEKLTGVKKRSAQATLAVIQKIRSVQAAFDAQTQQEQQQAQEEEAQREFVRQLSAEDLQHYAGDQLVKLQKAWEKPETRDKAVARLLSHQSQIPLRAGISVPALAITAAMADMPINLPLHFPEGTTVREALAIAATEMGNAENARIQQEMMEAEAEQEKAELDERKRRLNERKQEAAEHQQRAQELLTTLKLDEQLAKLNATRAKMEVQAQEEQQRQEDTKAQREFEESQRKQKEQEQEDKKKEQEQAREAKKLDKEIQQKANELKRLQKEIEKARKEAEVEEKRKVEKKDEAKQQKVVAEKRAKANKLEAEFREKMKPKPQPKSETPPTGKTKAEINKGTPTRKQQDKAKAKERADKRLKRGEEDTTLPEGRNPNTHDVQPKESTARISKFLMGRVLRIRLAGKVYEARVVGTNGKIGKDKRVLYVRRNVKPPGQEEAWPSAKEGEWKTEQSMVQLVLNASEGRALPRVDTMKAFGVAPEVEPHPGSVAPRRPVPQEFPGYPPTNDEIKSSPEAEVRWWWHFMRMGRRIQIGLGELGSFIYRMGMRSENYAMQVIGKHRRDLSDAGEWARKTFAPGAATGLLGGLISKAGRVTSSQKHNWGRLMSAQDIDAKLEALRGDTSEDAKQQRADLERAKKDLGFNPRELYRLVKDDAEVEAEIEYALKKAKETSGQESVYWGRHAEYLKNVLLFREDYAGETLVIMHTVESLPRKELRYLLPSMQVTRQWDDKTYIERRKYGLSKKDMARRVQNHYFEGVSASWRKKMESSDPAFKAQLDRVTNEVWEEMNNGTEKGLRMLKDFGLEGSEPESVIRQRIKEKAWQALTSEGFNEFSRSHESFGSFARERLGAYGTAHVDWTMGGLEAYLDKAARDIARHQMMREFLTATQEGNPDLPRWHNDPSVLKRNPEELGSMEAAEGALALAAAGINAPMGEWVTKYMALIRGRELGQDPLKNAAGGAARWMYATKLGHPATIITNMSVVLTLGMLHGPTHVWSAFGSLAKLMIKEGPVKGAKEFYHKALAAGAAPAGQAIYLEQDDHVPSTSQGVKKAAQLLAHHMVGPFRASEIMIRTVTAWAALAHYHEAVRVLQDTSAPEAAKLSAPWAMSKQQARRTLSKMFNFSEETIGKLEREEITDLNEKIKLEEEAMVNGSNEINFRSGPNYTMKLLAGNHAASTILRTFQSFAVNVIEAQGKHIWYPIIKGQSMDERVQGAKKALAVYPSAMLTGSLLSSLIAACFRDDDDEYNLKGDSPQARWLYNRINDLNTVGLFGKLERPVDVVNPLYFISGVYGRTGKNLGAAATNLNIAREDIWAGNLDDGMKHLGHTFWKLAYDEVTQLRGATDFYRKHVLDEGTYRKARIVSRGLEQNTKKTTSEKMQQKQTAFAASTYAKEREAVVNALARGDYFTAAEAAKEFELRIIRREGPEAVEKARQSARDSVMMKAPLMEWSRTTDVEKAKEELKVVMAELIDRRGADEARRLVTAHLAYVRGVNAILPKDKK